MFDVAVGGRRLALPAPTVRRLVAAVLAAERRDATISITFLGRESMRRLNAQYMGHDEPTDVLSFALPDPDGLAGDVYVCRWVAARQARRYGRPLREELVRLIVHGVLHVLGYDHPAGDERGRSPMWRRQERLVRRLA